MKAFLVKFIYEFNTYNVIGYALAYGLNFEEACDKIKGEFLKAHAFENLTIF